VCFLDRESKGGNGRERERERVGKGREVHL